MGHGTATINADHWPAFVTGLAKMADALYLWLPMGTDGQFAGAPSCAISGNLVQLNWIRNSDPISEDLLSFKIPSCANARSRAINKPCPPDIDSQCVGTGDPGVKPEIEYDAKHHSTIGMLNKNKPILLPATSYG